MTELTFATDSDFWSALNILESFGGGDWEVMGNTAVRVSDNIATAVLRQLRSEDISFDMSMV